MASNPRNRNGNARRKLRLWLRSRGDPCALCGQPIDYDLPAGDPWSFEMDEIIPVSRYHLGGYPRAEAAALDRENVQAAHRICNQRRGNALVIARRQDSADRGELPTSRDWGA